MLSKELLQALEDEGVLLTQNTTIDLLVADTTAEKQAKIDAVPRQALPGVTATFQFEDGTHTESDQLVFNGFTYTIVIQGNNADADALNTSQSVTIDSSTTCILIKNCVNATFQKVKCLIPDIVANGVRIESSTSTTVRYCYFRGDGKTANNSGVNVNLSGIVNCLKNYCSNTNRGITVARGIGFSDTNDSTGTDPNYGLYCYASTLMKNGTQPTGTTANELDTAGGVIR